MKECLLQRPYYRPPLPIPAWEIDLKQLYSMNFKRTDWLIISDAAEDRRMFLLAYETYLNRGFYDSEILKDYANLYCENESDRSTLKYMRRD